MAAARAAEMPVRRHALLPLEVLPRHLPDRGRQRGAELATRDRVGELTTTSAPGWQAAGWRRPLAAP